MTRFSGFTGWDKDKTVGRYSRPSNLKDNSRKLKGLQID